MSNNQVETRYAAIIFHGEKLVFLSDEFIEIPTLIAKGARKKKTLLDFLSTKGMEKPKIKRGLPEMVVRGHDLNYLVRPFLIEVESIRNTDGLAFIGFNDLKDLTLGPVTKNLVHRADIYAPLYLGTVREVPLLPEDQKKIYWERECLRHFKRKIPYVELCEFEDLIYSASSLRRINEAFADICNTYRVNPKDYIAYLKYREEKREALK